MCSTMRRRSLRSPLPYLGIERFSMTYLNPALLLQQSVPPVVVDMCEHVRL